MLLLLIWWADRDAAANWAPALLAQIPPTVNPSVLESYGPGGIIAMVALGLMWAERTRANKADDQVAELNKIMREMVVPALTQTRDALTQATTATTEAMNALRKDHRKS